MAYSTVNIDFMKRPGNYNIGMQILDQEFTMSRYFDCTVDNLSSGAYYKIWGVPANFALLEAYVICSAGTESSDTLDIVDDDSATTTFVSNADLSATTKVTATNARKNYASAGFIVIKPDAALTTAKFHVVIKGIVHNTSM